MLIGISGMISSGKSTLSKNLNKHYKKSMLLNEFQEEDVVFNTMLDWFYKNRPHLNIAFQAYVVEKHINEVQSIIREFNSKNLDKNSDIIFLDRFGAEHYVFAKVILEKLPKKILKAYEAIFKELVSKDDFPELAIFLDVSFENFKERLFKRGREIEINTWSQNEEYFKKLHEVYKKTFIDIVNRYEIKYEIIDTNNLTPKQVELKAIEIINKYKEKKYENTSMN
ncbi:deoxynucleoside kinase [Mycoplasmopsis synoviae]|uniref:deoxynucleoside kinase n=1 Tax=Mycoplasmopsis synoviae TaxID=2109 RepID=UPI000CA1CE85|nr:deoxynucleoside kinase [Mycoplasmopsis synoviae]AKJ20602.1 Deoxyadenosine kinase / Deoxyguanosine kinase [Mycoplasmopsis synoviae]AQU47922.1 Deoxyadenosine kinase / Deoxyguanosine kinase [Mycoplasmopsis synoviae]AWL84169.1 deoxyguanosine kinase [Mycoplasmopsis synoviae]QLE13890.1 deoxyguanosine kinase [Mycoplasmopsis synoviae]UZF64016.1 deoxynucleoside kinase [Mycoplasmopsis synoviae]